MKALNLETMPIDDLWQLYEQVGRVLAEQLTSEKRKLEQRLSQLRGDVAHLVGSGSVGLTLRSIRNIRIPTIPRRPGRAAGKHPVGLVRC